ncbi:hypothetical protein [Mycoplana dimorpha]|uniref:Biotin carboxyl carrier protein n=1 Tax=Mycoplana dimorpha TaxID=28320 RepID=A0A2T5BEZ4_MYCDI|nr:hypothetical protein [Mycoplana dimorpha]PTM97556.1 biotin carboxyl carrier protein [Mycoplana dimorpha]
MTDDIAARLEMLMVCYGIGELDLEEGDFRLHLRHRAPPAEGPPADPVPAAAAAVLRATAFGTLRLSHPAGAAPAPSLPRKVRQGEIVAYAAIGPLLRPIVAERDATLVRLLHADGAEIGYGDQLFEVRWS